MIWLWCYAHARCASFGHSSGFWFFYFILLQMEDYSNLLCIAANLYGKVTTNTNDIASLKYVIFRSKCRPGCAPVLGFKWRPRLYVELCYVQSFLSLLVCLPWHSILSFVSFHLAFLVYLLNFLGFVLKYLSLFALFELSLKFVTSFTLNTFLIWILEVPLKNL